MTKQSEDQRKSPPRDPRATMEAARSFASEVHSATSSSQMNRMQTVSGRWLVQGILITLVAAWIAVYIAFCLLFYQGQWQFVFAPPNLAHTRAANQDWLASSWARRRGPNPKSLYTPPNAVAVARGTGLPITDVGFDYTQLGVKQLDGWWIPTAPASGSPPAADSEIVVLFCSDGHTDLSENSAAYGALHSLGVSVFAFDYRGFGASQPGHPSQQKAYADGAAALRYLTGLRHIPVDRIVIYGAELGAAVAAHVAAESPGLAGLILENPQPSLLRQVEREQRIHVLPMWLIFTQRFDISRTLPELHMPKLIVATPAQPEFASGTAAVYREVASPKQIVHIQPTSATSLYGEPKWRETVGGFLGGLASPRSQAR